MRTPSPNANPTASSGSESSNSWSPWSRRKSMILGNMVRGRHANRWGIMDATRGLERPFTVIGFLVFLRQRRLCRLGVGLDQAALETPLGSGPAVLDPPRPPRNRFFDRDCRDGFQTPSWRWSCSKNPLSKSPLGVDLKNDLDLEMNVFPFRPEYSWSISKRAERRLENHAGVSSEASFSRRMRLM